MKIKSVVETDPKELATMLYATNDELFNLIVEISEVVCAADFDKRVVDYFNYHHDILKDATEGSL